ncbi:MAG: SMEK domain-containing protein [Opitutales bacterium]|nr:SMEK domain-containing protein [Opitutales bacterium]
MRDDQIRKLVDALTLLKFKISGRSIASLRDINVVSEDFFTEFLNELHGLRLKNVNKEKINYPAIDLTDSDKRIAFQITSTKAAKKIQGTIDKFVEHGLDADYDDLYILILGDKQTKYTTIDSKGTQFNPDRHIIDIDYLIRKISCGQPIDRLKKLEKLVIAENLIHEGTLPAREEKAANPLAEPAKRNWAKDHRFSSLAIGCLIGEWREDFDGDRKIIETFLPDGYTPWLRDIRSVLQEMDSPLKLKNGNWSVIDRAALWASLSGCIFDEDLEHFKNAAEVVLSEIDPKFEIPVKDRLFNFDNKKMQHSDALRRGLSGTLAYLGTHGDSLNQCSQHKARTVALLATRTILGSDDFKLWGSINNRLPYLAEASPDEFLSAVERASICSPNPFLELFNQEQGGVFSQNYITGLLWGLELLAWNDEYLTRVTVALAILTQIDPGGQYNNRPGNSLTEIFLPWFPQTLAPFDKQIIALKTLKREYLPTLIDLLLSLLPKGHSISSGTYTPKFTDITESQKRPQIPIAEYWKRVSEIANLAFELGREHRSYLERFAGEIDHLPDEFQERLIQFLESEVGRLLFDGHYSEIWKILRSIVVRHRKYSEADWALPSNRINKLDEFVKSIEPSSIEELSEPLFKQDEFDLYEETGDWKAQREKLQRRRNDSIRRLLNQDGLEAVVQFSEKVESPYRVGYALGCVSDSTIDGKLLPYLLGCDESPFINGYINARHSMSSWEWVDGLDKSEWCSDQVLQLCLSLPFTEETWKRTKDWLNDSARDYWTKIEFNPQQVEGDLLVAVDALLAVERPLRAIDCLHCRHFKNAPLDNKRTTQALMDAVNTKESAARMDQYEIIQLISALQDSSDSDEDNLVKIEWAYLRLLDPHSSGKPKTLYRKLATDPQFFCEILKMIYISEDLDQTHTDSPEPDESTKKIAENAWHLLHDWDRAPGVADDGDLDTTVFSNWISVAVETCQSTGHLGIGLDQIGKALFYSPAEPDGSLWIAKVVADVLNKAEYKDMRNGYSCEGFNSRGCHTPSVKASMDLYDEWSKKAEAVEAEGFHRFASELKGFAEGYKREAERLQKSDPFE